MGYYTDTKRCEVIDQELQPGESYHPRWNWRQHTPRDQYTALRQSLLGWINNIEEGFGVVIDKTLYQIRIVEEQITDLIPSLERGQWNVIYNLPIVVLAVDHHDGEAFVQEGHCGYFRVRRGKFETTSAQIALGAFKHDFEPSDKAFASRAECLAWFNAERNRIAEEYFAKNPPVGDVGVRLAKMAGLDGILHFLRRYEESSLTPEASRRLLNALLENPNTTDVLHARIELLLRKVLP